jgi:hypothetical protein
MRRSLVWVGILTIAGLVLGGVFGSVVSRAIGCVMDGQLPPGATCDRVLGTYVSAGIYYTVAASLLGAAIGLVLGLFLAIPTWSGGARRAEAVHPLEVPFIWFGLQLLELVVLVPVLLFWVPDPGRWPEAARVAVWFAALIGLTVVNYRVRRRFIPR